MNNFDLSVILLHADMVDKQNDLVTTSVTLIDVHDLARSCRTFGVRNLFVAHPSGTLRKLVRTLKVHWQEGLGASYNPNRKDALGALEIVTSLDEAIEKIDLRTGKLPKIIATSAKSGSERISFADMSSLLKSGEPYLMLLGTGWGMSDSLLARADYFLEPINGPSDYNHLSVRSACAIMLDRLTVTTCNTTN